MDRATATAAPRVLKLGGKEYRLSPLRDEDWGEFEQWVQDRIVEIAKRNMDGLPPHVQEALIIHAYDKAEAISFCDPQAAKAMNTYDGAVKITWLCLRHEHPDITTAEVAKLLFDPEILTQVMDKLPVGMSPAPRSGKKKRVNRKAVRKKRKTARHST